MNWHKIEYKIERHWLDENGDAHSRAVVGSPQIGTAIAWLKDSAPMADQGEVMRLYQFEQLERGGPWELASDGFLEWDGEEVANYGASWASHLVPDIASVEESRQQGKV